MTWLTSLRRRRSDAEPPASDVVSSALPPSADVFVLPDAAARPAAAISQQKSCDKFPQIPRTMYMYMYKFTKALQANERHQFV